MGDSKVKTRYITAFYGVFKGKLISLEDKIARCDDEEKVTQYKKELKNLEKLLVKLEAQDEGFETIGKDDSLLARELLKQSEKLREQAYQLDPSLNPVFSQDKAA